jgi:hypothetical protein
MLSLVDETWEWLDRAEQAREVAGQLTDPRAKQAVLQLAESFERLARAAVTPAVLRRRELARRRQQRNSRFRPPVATQNGKSGSGGDKEIGQHRGLLAPEERARITELQDALIERFFDHSEAVAGGDETRAKELKAEIDGLLREKEEVEKWAGAGSA